MSQHHLRHIVDDYRTRLLACVTASLLLAISAVRFWPNAEEASDLRPVYRVAEQETIEIDEIQPTRQAASAPAPPAPPIPIVVPDDQVLEDVELDFTDGLLPIDAPGEEASPEGTSAVTRASASGVTAGPKTVRFVEPEYTKEARRKRIRAELVVRVLVNEQGRVEQSTIVERFLLGDDGSAKQPVEMLGYGLEEAALSAADRWMFRPARKDGKPVASHTVLTFTFGVDA